MVKEKTEESKRGDKGEQATHAVPPPQKGNSQPRGTASRPRVLNSFFNLSLGIQEPK